MKEIGGYFELENLVEYSSEYHKDALHLNLGRNALVYLIKAKSIKKIYLPFYLCDSVENAIKNLDVKIEKYHINENFKPLFDKALSNGEYLYIVNYFGLLSEEAIENFQRKFKNIILDNTQAFFQKPLKMVDTIYTCRKFFGVPDGAYLYTDANAIALDADDSQKRFTHLLGRKNEAASKHFGEYKNNEDVLNGLELKSMSSQTKEMLERIDYDFAKQKRNENFDFLLEKLGKINKLKLHHIDGAFCYPLFIENGSKIKKLLLEKLIYIPTLWPDLKHLNHFEKRCVENILPIPCDQRYGLDDMKLIVDLLAKYSHSIHVRELSQTDAKIINKWHNDKELYSLLVGKYYGPSLEETKKWIDSYLDRSNNTFRGIVSDENGEDIGVVYLVDNGDKKSEVGIFVADKNKRGQGFGEQMLKWLVDFGFNVLKLKEIELYTLEDNKNAIELYSKLGFVVDKSKGEIVEKDGVTKNAIYMHIEGEN